MVGTLLVAMAGEVGSMVGTLLCWLQWLEELEQWFGYWLQWLEEFDQWLLEYWLQQKPWVVGKRVAMAGESVGTLIAIAGESVRTLVAMAGEV